jgi:ABC-type transporter Mla MlaB component
MDIQVSTETGRVPVTIFHIVGDVDATTYEQLQTRAREAHAAGAANLVLDLAGVSYISSAGIRALNAIFLLLRTAAPAESDAVMHAGISAGTFKSPHLKLANLNQRVTDALRTAGVDMFLDFFPSVPEAVASF